jgi:hypothetical protein
MNSIRPNYPQTHVQTIGPLLLLLSDLGFGPEDLSSVNRAYHFAMKLWAVNFQSSSRPFICHAVGTAGMTAAHGGDLPVIQAAMLHAAYSTGDFGVRIPGAFKSRRRSVRGVIGHEAEDLVFGFHSFLNRYGTNWARLLEERGDGELQRRERTILFMRVCNDLDDVSDLPFSSDSRRGRINRLTRSSILLAQAIGRPDLAEQLEAEFRQYKDLRFLPEEVSERYETGHIELPKAFRKKVIPGLLEATHRRWSSRESGSGRSNLEIL